MKILIFSSYFLPHKGGVENYVYQTSKRLVEKGHKVWVVSSRLSGMKKTETIDGIKVIRIPSLEILPDQLTVPSRSVFNFVDSSVGKVDVVITHTRFYPLTFAGGSFARFHNTPWIHIEHGTEQVEYSNPIVRAGARFVDATTGRWVMRHADVYGVSKASCALSKKLGAKSCKVLYNGVDTGFFDGRESSHKSFNIVYVGRLIKEKGVQDLLKAAKGLKVKVIIVGDGPYKKELKKLGGIFVGEKKPGQIRDILSKADLFVNPSYAEGLPTSVLEAGAMGLPVIATDVGGTGEIISNNKSGFLFRQGDTNSLREKINILVKDAKLRDKFGRSLQRTVRQKFDWDIVAAKLETHLNSLR